MLLSWNFQTSRQHVARLVDWQVVTEIGAAGAVPGFFQYRVSMPLLNFWMFCTRQKGSNISVASLTRL